MMKRNYKIMYREVCFSVSILYQLHFSSLTLAKWVIATKKQLDYTFYMAISVLLRMYVTYLL